MYDASKFIEWLYSEMNDRAMKNVDLADAAGISHARVSQVLSGDRPGRKFLTGVARALNIRPEEVFRQAGVLPSKPSADPLLEEVVYQMAQLSEEQQEVIMTLVRTLVARRLRETRIGVSVPVDTDTDTSRD